MTILTLKPSDKATARGRNGLFKPKNIWVSTYSGYKEVCISVQSRRAGKSDPISLWISRDEALALANMLAKVAADEGD